MLARATRSGTVTNRIAILHRVAADAAEDPASALRVLQNLIGHSDGPGLDDFALREHAPAILAAAQAQPESRTAALEVADQLGRDGWYQLKDLIERAGEHPDPDS